MYVDFSFTSPTFLSLNDELKRLFQSRRLRLRQDVKLVFLCGSKSPLNDQTHTNREILIDYSERYHPEWKFMLAEDIFDRLSRADGGKPRDLFSLEKSMADVADSVIIILESIGAATELGAFTLNKKLCRKLLVLNDKGYIDEESFLNNAVGRYLETHSMFGGIKYGNFNVILEFVSLIAKGLEEIREDKNLELPLDQEKIEPSKALLFVITDLIRILGPLNSKNVAEIAKITIGNIQDNEIYDLLSMGVGVGFLETKIEGTKNYFNISKSMFKEAPFCGFDRRRISPLRMKFLAKYSKMASISFASQA